MTETKTISDVATPVRVVDPTLPKMSKAERLMRWATVLSVDPRRILNTLNQIERMQPAERLAYRVDDSPLSLAAADPVLAEEGLKGDTVGDAARFFELSEGEMHAMNCYCIHGSQAYAGHFADYATALARNA